MKEEKWNYACPRCDYETTRKDTMAKHLNRKRKCPGGKSNIEITEVIKTIILTERVYHPPKESNRAKVVNNIMNFINTNLTPTQLLETYAQYNKINIKPVDEYLEDKFTDTAISLANPEFCFELKIDDLLSVIDEISSVNKHQDDLNILYDSKEDRINFKDDDEWKKSIVIQGLKRILEKLQEYYLDYYECFLITKITSNSVPFVKQQNRELIDVYYRFIAAFDLQPYVHNQRDYYIVKSITDRRATEIAEEFMERYKNVKACLKLSDKRTIKRDVLEIIKKNSASNINTLKTRISDMFCNDSTFKEFMENSVRENRAQRLTIRE